ncbi:MAG TPA: glycine C-acetyltransferase [Chthonomonas sp.]|uniref:glycine C-acetyltransferase n=1 Tax=Chthonomonas sp. TaxID=2282153 RepID=UPI002B4B6B5B|nr:glycine C-acetyltransferase [Chthonomonas sp.]HLI47702.1 glycine C-acetyltransferase [Chthonomonas sp.]
MNGTLLQWLEVQIEGLKEQNLYKPLVVMDTPSEARITVNGKKGVINLSSNNYLGLANHPKVKEAAIRAVERWGAGAGAVRPIIGTMSLHMELERRLAAFKHVEAALVFQSGFTANAGVIPTITDAEDVILTDELNHASIIDGVRLSKAQRKIYKHLDMNALEEALKESQGAKKRLIITDGVFSMDGDVAPLKEIVELAERYDAAVMVDDAHGSGVMGGGRGTAYHFGVHERIDIQLGTLSKAVGVMGGYIAGSARLIDWLTQRARPFLFSTAQPPAVVAAVIAAIELMESDSSLTERLWENTRYWKEGLRKLGFDTGVSVTPITPVMVGDEGRAQQLQRGLFEEGVMALAIVYPTVAKGKARVRTMPSAMHTKADLDDALMAFEKVGKRLGII